MKYDVIQTSPSFPPDNKPCGGVDGRILFAATTLRYGLRIYEVLFAKSNRKRLFKD